LRDRIVAKLAIWPFRRKPILDPETAAWHAHNLAWLIRQFGGGTTLAEATLVLPKPGFFTFDGERGMRWRCASSSR